MISLKGLREIGQSDWAKLLPAFEQRPDLEQGLGQYLINPSYFRRNPARIFIIFSN